MLIYNTLTKKKEIFEPIKKGEVTFYSCGPTVYDLIHIGNARPFVVFDILRKYLIYLGYKVTFVQNFTDVDDKMIKKANETNTTVLEVASKYIEEYFHDADNLGISRADFYPKATEHINEIIVMVEKLIAKGCAYYIDSDVYFETSKFTEYGKLSNQNINSLKSGARIEINDKKRSPLDFALWKEKKEGEPFWPSPFGDGRPGWHIECSAMANFYLGNTIDLHSGGSDLMFPHHENEIAQSESANDKKFVNYWIHNGHINVDDEKMSKSVGNFLTVRDITKKYGYKTLRFFLLATHYKSPINYTEEAMTSATGAISRIENFFNDTKFLMDNNNNVNSNTLGANDETLKKIENNKNEFFSALDDDLNTPLAISKIFDTINECNKYMTNIDVVSSSHKIISEMCNFFGFIEQNKKEFSEEINFLLEKRKAARENKNFKLSDELRSELYRLGVSIKDTEEGQNAFWTN